MSDLMETESVTRDDVGAIVRVERFRNGALCDHDEATPALETFRNDGSRAMIAHLVAGRLHNSETGEPALFLFAASGAIKLVEFHLEGHLQDGPLGEPARMLFNEEGDIVRADSRLTGQKPRRLRDFELAALGCNRPGWSWLKPLLHPHRATFIEP